MEFSLTIRQKEFQDNFPTLDIKDAAIVDFLARFAHSKSMVKKIVEGKVYFWFDYGKIVTELPILRLNKESIRKRMRELIRLKIFDSHPENQGERKVFFAFGDAYELTHKHRENNTDVQHEGAKHRENGTEASGKQSLQHRDKNPDNHIYHNQETIDQRERDAHANSKPSKAEISKRDVAPGPESPEQITPWNEDLLAAEFLKHIAGETPETAAKHAKEICQKIDMQMPPTDRAPLRYDQYPRPTNAKELREAMSAYFKDNPHEWSDGVLEEGKAKNWAKEKVVDTMTMFCAHQESEGNLKRTYGQYKGMIVKWFLNQSRFDAPVQGNGYQAKKEPSVIPSNIQRFK